MKDDPIPTKSHELSKASENLYPQESLYHSKEFIQEASDRLSGRSTELRVEAADFIERLGAKLDFPRKTIALAQRYFMQYSLFYSVELFPIEDVSLTCVFVASKVQETTKKIRQVILAAFYLANPDYEGRCEVPADSLEAHRKTVMGFERLILEAVGFRFNVSLPHSLFVRMLCTFEISSNGDIFKRGSSFINTCFHGAMCLRFHFAAVAAYALYRSTREVPVLERKIADFCLYSLNLHYDLFEEIERDYQLILRVLEERRTKCREDFGPARPRLLY